MKRTRNIKTIHKVFPKKKKKVLFTNYDNHNIGRS